jgi:hypothetical protein
MKETTKEQKKESSASVLVIILHCETRSCDKNINALTLLFSDPFFHVKVYNTAKPHKLVTSHNFTEHEMMKHALLISANGPYLDEPKMLEPQYRWKNMPVLIVKDSSVSNMSPSILNIRTGITHRIKTALEKALDADLFFLCKWNDTCDLYSDAYPSKDEFFLKWSQKPNGTQAILYRPKTRDLIIEEMCKEKEYVAIGDLLSKKIANRELKAAVFVPNLIDYDINLATSKKDFNKLNQCEHTRDVPYASSTTSESTKTIWLWILIILIVVVAWICVNKE